MQTHETVIKRSALSFFSLITQSGYLAFLGLVAFYLLTKFSSPAVLGVYASVLSSLTIFNYFSDLGIAGWIIHLENPSADDLATAFWTQSFLSVFAVLLGLFFQEKIFSNLQNLPSGTNALYFVTLLSFVIVTIRAIPSVLLEKEHKIYLVALVSAIEGSIFYILLIVLLLQGLEIQAITIAVLVRSIFGTVIMFYLRPFWPRGRFQLKILKKMLAYGIPLQSNSFVAIVKDDLLILFLGSKIGLHQLGILQFAKKWAEFALRLINDNFNRILFPLFARYQKDNQMLRYYLEKVYYYQFMMLFPLIFGIAFEYENLLRLNDAYFIKWQSSIHLFYWFLAGAFLVGLYSPLFSLYNAIGKVKLTLFVQIFFTCLLWGLIFYFVRLQEIIFIPIAFVLMSSTGLLLLIYTVKKFQARLLEQLTLPLFAGILMCVAIIGIRGVARNLEYSLVYTVSSEIIVAAITYLLIIFYFDKSLIVKIRSYSQRKST